MVTAADAADSGDGQELPGTLVAGVFVAGAPAFTGKGLRLFAPCGRTALCFSVRTARQISALPPQEGRVTAVCSGCHQRADKLELLATGSALGEVQLWDAKTCLRLGGLRLARPVLALRWPAPGVLLALLGQEGGSAQVERLEVEDVAAPRRDGAALLSAGAAGPFDARDGALALADGTDLHVWAEGWSAARKHPGRQRITALVVDAQKQFVVTGDEKGVVLTWWGIFKGEQTRQVPARWHWHANPVRALLQCGPMILSGGDEGVLCIRGAHDSAHAVRHVPRFPGPLLHLAAASDGVRICASLGGNTLALIDDMQGWIKPRWVHGLDVPLMGLRGSTEPQGGSVFHPLAEGGVAMTSSGRRVQFLDDEGRLQPSRTLVVSRGDCVHSVAGAPEYKWMLWHVAFSASAAHVMTCESRRAPALERFRGERAQSSVLKWWVRSEGGEYALHSVAHSAHAGEVTVALAHPLRERRFFTAALDGSFRFWDLLRLGDGPGRAAEQAGAEGSGARQCWQCVLSGSWHGWPVLRGCLSADGSALALGLRGFVALWETEDGAELPPLALREAQEVEYLQSLVACERLLLLAGARDAASEEVLCWDLAGLGVLARLDLAATLEGEGRSLLRASAPAGGRGLHLLACRLPRSELRLWWLSPGAAGTAAEWRAECVASLSLQHSVLDACFLGAGRRVLCWTSAHELWDLDLSGRGPAGGGAVGPAAPLPGPRGEEEGEGAPKASRLAQVVGARAVGRGPGGGDAAWRLSATPLRTTAAQQAGIAPRLLERVVPPHVPSHMLHPPSVIWAGLLSTFSKSPQAAAGSRGGAADGGRPPGPPEGPARGGGAAPRPEGEPPPWVGAGQAAAAVAQAEVVDADWMDSFVDSALRGGE